MLQFILSWVHLDPANVLELIKATGYVGIALFVFAESGVLMGMFLPGDSLLFAAGLLAAGGVLSIIPLVIIVVVAAILGDSIGYWFGTKVGTALYKRPDSRFFKQEYIHRTQHFYETYGGRAIILARFVPIVRTVAPVLAGIGSMEYRTFLSYNVVGGLLWGAGVTLLGYFLGSIIPDAEHYLLPITLGIIVISFLPILINFFRHR